MMVRTELRNEDMAAFVDNVGRAIEDELAAVEGEDEGGDRQELAREAALATLQWLIDSGHFTTTED